MPRSANFPDLIGGTSANAAFNAIFKDSVNRLSTADPKNVQEIAASQLEILGAYYMMAPQQSKRSFFWAVTWSLAGLVMFASAIAFSILWDKALVSITPLISGAIVEAVSGIGFYLYGKTSSQVSLFYRSLEVLQRYMLANSICESLDGDDRAKARTNLIQEISRFRVP